MSHITLRPRLRAGVLALSLALLLVPPQPVAANAPPDPPVIETPKPTDVNPADVHMEMGAPYHDPDGDAHAATDWEIRMADDGPVVWAGYNSAELIHAHFSDGEFQGPLAGKDRLDYGIRYVFRVRFQDSRGAWSAWSEQPFRTSRMFTNPMFQTKAVLSRPLPNWLSDAGASVDLPVGAEARLEDSSGAALLMLRGTGDGIEAHAGAWLSHPGDIRLHVKAPAEAGVRLPSSRLSVVTGEAERLVIYLPDISMAPGEHRVFWISSTGATFYGTPEQDHPDRQHLARDTPLPWQLRPDYQLQAVGMTYQLPISLAFVPNPGTDPAAPRFYVTELYGQIKVVTNDGRVFNFAEKVLNFNPSEIFPGSGEMGVIGICLSPTSRDLYATMIYNTERSGLRNKVVRFRTENGLTATSVEDILVVQSGQGNARASHQVQQCSFGPDGKLYVFMADGPNPDHAQDDAKFGGKVLRLNPDGSAPTDNPFYDPANPTAPISYQYTKGHRNAFGQTWRQSDGTFYLTENGPTVDRLVRLEAGRNYGWNGTDASMRTGGVYIWPEAHWAPVGLTFVEGEAATAVAPPSRNSLFIATSGATYAEGPQRAGKAIQEFTFNPDGSLNQAPTILARYVGEGRGSIADLKARPDGLYFTGIYVNDGIGGPVAAGGHIWRIIYTGQAAFTPSATSGTGPLTVTFTDTSDFAGAAAWAWDFGDGQTSTERSPSHTFSGPGRYVVSLTVTGAEGRTDEALALVTVTDGKGHVPEPDATLHRLATTPSPQVIFFPETGAGVGNGFKYFWEHRGGPAVFGYPITQEFQERNPADGQVYTVQYFERARFEYHPEHKGTPYETELGLLGRQVMAERADEPAFQPVADPGDGTWFAETGHTLSGPFRHYWETSGGLDIFGFPISEPHEQESDTDGENYMVQYFERARMEYHPELQGTPGEIQLERLGTNIFTRRPAPRSPE